MARFRSVRAKHAGAWLDPGADEKDTEFSHQRFLTACLLCLGLPNPQAQFITRCKCGQDVDKWGHHFLHYQSLGANTAAHNGVRDLMGKIYGEAGISLLSEVPGQLLARSGTQYQQRTDLVLQENIASSPWWMSPSVTPLVLPDSPEHDLATSSVLKKEKIKISNAYSQRPRHTAFLPAVFRVIWRMGTSSPRLPSPDVPTLDATLNAQRPWIRIGEHPQHPVPKNLRSCHQGHCPLPPSQVSCPRSPSQPRSSSRREK